ANVTYEGGDWSDDISHGELIRSGHDEKMTISACNMRFLYQGRDPSVGGEYGRLPYKLGLLTLQE
ncbi:MAG TPA: non-reducing end alpha-L-arabinofuranosidase family hydrolase, partial [Sorangium sp.]|nr:non-reducing end alpha-L-arabinofuranosidase family hydrolase [Sorangium sp.]